MKHASVVLAILFLALATAPLTSESFRVRSVTTLEVSGNDSETRIADIGYNDAVGILFPENTIFLRAVEIEIRIPREILRYQNSMAYGVYRNVEPAPKSGVIDYRGIQEVYQPLPSRLSFVLQIPLVADHKLKSGPYATVLERVHDPNTGPMVFRLQPVMKGLPPTIDEMTFEVRVKPLLTDEGALALRLQYPDDGGKPVRILIDEQPADRQTDLYILAPGDHHLSVVSDHYRNEVRMFTVESARITPVDIMLQDTTPTLILVAPENTAILVNDTPVENTGKPLPIEPGPYTIQFKIGDYEIIRQIVAEKGKDYTVSMQIDINVSESP